MIVEVCVQGIASACAACEGGARRIELCEDLEVGGVTPSAGTIAVVCRRLKVATHVLIRPRGGNFVYTDDELSAMAHDVETAKALGARGVVLGLLRTDGTVDAEGIARFVELAAPLRVTFHKAFDEARDAFDALDTLIALGIERVLTSGQAPTAIQGVVRLEQLTRRAAGRLAIMAGGKVAESDLPDLVTAGLREIHVGSAVQVEGHTNAALVRQFVSRVSALEPA
ncbi:MAG: copper homeostasis protein CutC [Isosphaeraceae bacterium]|nr:copper homeostasis protein CutC [Isosphaeraceae bacterium]